VLGPGSGRQDGHLLRRPDQKVKGDEAGGAGGGGDRRGLLLGVAGREGGQLGFGGAVGEAGQLVGIEAQVVGLDP
jgi:hypothetical protein